MLTIREPGKLGSAIPEIVLSLESISKTKKERLKMTVIVFCHTTYSIHQQINHEIIVRDVLKVL